MLALAVIAPAASAAPIKVVTPGEQNTQSTEATWPLYPKLLQTALGSGYNVLNNGDISGSVLSSYTGTPAGVHPFATPGQKTYDDSVNPPPDIVLIGPFGEHDLRVVLVAQWKGLATVANFAKDYDALVTDYTKLSSKPKVFLMTPIVLPNYNPPDTMNFVKGVVLPAVQQVATDRKLPVIDLYTEFSANLAMYMGTDGQVNAKGQVKITDMIVAALKAASADGGVDAAQDAHDAAADVVASDVAADTSPTTGTGGATAGTGGASGTGGATAGTGGATGSGGSTAAGTGGVTGTATGGRSGSSSNSSSGCAIAGVDHVPAAAWALLLLVLVPLLSRRKRSKTAR